MAIAPTTVVALNRAVAVAEVQDPQTALDLVSALDLAGYHVYHAVRAALLTRLGRTAEAVDAYDRAAALTTNRVEEAYLCRARDTLRG
jgi:RNA polymerase sigma-70 factor (ECF subfamily)